MIYEVLSPPNRYEPLSADHPGVGTECPGCGEPIRAGQRPALVNGQVPEGEELDKALAGRAHNVQALLAHETCAVEARQP